MQLETSCSIYLTTLKAASHPVLILKLSPLFLRFTLLRAFSGKTNILKVDAGYSILDILSVTNIFVGFMSLMVDDGAGNVSDGFKGGAESSRALLPSSLISSSHLRQVS